MLVSEADSTFERFLADRGMTVDEADPVAAIGAMLDWYEDERAEDAVPDDEDGDMLLFQWGTYDWGEGPTFEVDITRQLIDAADEDDDAIFQLSLTSKYEPTDATASLGKGNRWCTSPAGIDEFRRYVETHPAVAFVGENAARVTELSYENVG